MILNNEDSVLAIRAHIAEVLKDKIEQPNYIELCEKMETFILNGINLPATSESSIEKTIREVTKTFCFPTLDEVYKPKESELEVLCKKHLGELFITNGHKCTICGYSEEFNAIIIGYNDDTPNGITLGEKDILLIKGHNNYLYINKSDLI